MYIKASEDLFSLSFLLLPLLLLLSSSSASRGLFRGGWRGRPKLLDAPRESRPLEVEVEQTEDGHGGRASKAASSGAPQLGRNVVAEDHVHRDVAVERQGQAERQVNRKEEGAVLRQEHRRGGQARQGEVPQVVNLHGTRGRVRCSQKPAHPCCECARDLLNSTTPC